MVRKKPKDMYSAIDMVVDKIERQTKRLRQKGRKRKAQQKGRARENELDTDAVAHVEDDGEPRLVRSEQMFPKPMDVDEAIMQLDLSGQQFLVFTNSATDKLNVLYKRDDGHYGLIEPITE